MVTGAASQADYTIPDGNLLQRAGQAITTAAGIMVHGLGHAGAGAAIAANHWILVQEVPFHRWFVDYGYNTVLPPNECWKARGTALLATLEGVVRTVAEIVMYLYAQIMNDPDDSERRFDVLKAQWQGLVLSLYAVLSPNEAKITAHNASDRPLIGCPGSQLRWGTPYTGQYTINFWTFNSSSFPWREVAIRA